MNPVPGQTFVTTLSGSNIIEIGGTDANPVVRGKSEPNGRALGQSPEVVACPYSQYWIVNFDDLSVADTVLTLDLGTPAQGLALLGVVTRCIETFASATVTGLELTLRQGASPIQGTLGSSGALPTGGQIQRGFDLSASQQNAMFWTGGETLNFGVTSYNDDLDQLTAGILWVGAVFTRLLPVDP